MCVIWDCVLAQQLQLLMDGIALTAAWTVFTGLAPPAKDVLLPEMLGSEESEALAATLYASDFISQFADVLGIEQPPGYLQLHVRLIFDPQRAPP